MLRKYMSYILNKLEHFKGKTFIESVRMIAERIFYKTERDFLSLDLTQAPSFCDDQENNIYFELATKDNFIRKEQYQVLDKNISERFTERLLNKGYTVFLAITNNEIVGTAYFSETGVHLKAFFAELNTTDIEAVYLIYYYVRPEFRSQRIGQKLLEEGIRYYSSKGFKTLIAMVKPDSDVSYSILKKCKFRKVCSVRLLMVCFIKMYWSTEAKDEQPLGASLLSSSGKVLLKF